MYKMEAFTATRTWENDLAGLERRRRSGEFWMRRGLEHEAARVRESSPGVIRRFLAIAGGVLVAFGRKLQAYGAGQAAAVRI
jgi:hypothetical protein